MTTVTYEVVEHDGGWAYKAGDVFSETFATHDEARAAADAAAENHVRAGASEHIEFQDEAGQWHEEETSGYDRPDTEVRDTLSRHHVVSRHSPRAHPVRSPAASPAGRPAALGTMLALAGLAGLLAGYALGRRA